MKIIFTEKGKSVFWDYFNVADEIYESISGPPVTHPFPALTLEDLDQDFVARAREAADAFGLSWPPYLPEAEEFALDHPEVNDRG